MDSSRMTSEEGLSWKSLGKGFAGALPAAAKGAAAGSAAGPYGAAFGALAGLAGGAIKAAAKPAAAPAVPAAAAPARPAPIPAVEPAVPSAVALPTAQPAAAAGQLLQLLQNPLFLRVLAALAGGGPAQPLTLGGKKIPPVALLTAVGELAGRASFEAEESEPETDDSYLRGPDGKFRCDPSVPAERAAVVYDLLSSYAPPTPSTRDDTSEAQVVDWLLSNNIAKL